MLATANVVMALLALLRGGPWERLGAATLIYNAVASGLFQNPHLTGPQYGFLIVDSASFVALAAIALISRLWWATWVAGLMLFSVSIHLARIVDAQVNPYAYYLGVGLCGYLHAGTVIVGTLARRPFRPAQAIRHALRTLFGGG